MHYTDIVPLQPSICIPACMDSCIILLNFKTIITEPISKKQKLFSSFFTYFSKLCHSFKTASSDCRRLESAPQTMTDPPSCCRFQKICFLYVNRAKGRNTCLYRLYVFFLSENNKQIHFLNSPQNRCEH